MTKIRKETLAQAPEKVEKEKKLRLLKKSRKAKEKRKKIKDAKYFEERSSREETPPIAEEAAPIEEEEVIDLSQVTKYIKKELAKPEPNHEEIEKFMKVTYEYRRNFILTKAPMVKTMREAFPGLFNFEQVKNEFHRIKEDDTIYQTFLKNLKQHWDTIQTYTNNQSIKDLISLKSREYKHDSEHLNYIKTAGALLGLPSFFDIPLKRILVPDWENNVKDVINSYVIIGCKSNFKNYLNKDAHFTVFAEKVKMCETNDLRAAIFAYCATHYLFNISYDESCNELTAVLEKLFMEINPDMTDATEKVQDFEDLLLGQDYD